ncbi:MAG: ribosomal protein S18-alanine N-acetyltransferase [Gemmatimonadota bacterium]|nr:ribosomal protein S18-alanine N-acetyltransferase [Gemmatimonadota bacterium]
MTISIRNGDMEDVSAICAIERESFGDPWTRAMFYAYIRGSACYQLAVAVCAGSVVGYAVTQLVEEESELLNIAVHSACRSRGVGGALLGDAMSRARVAGATEMWLDVRASNLRARALYAKRGFCEMSVRRRYYVSPVEDAVVMRAELASMRNESVRCAGRSFSSASGEVILSPASHFPRQETQ